MSDVLLLLVMALAAYRLWRIVGLDDWPPSRRLRGEIEVRSHQWQQVAADTEERSDRLRAWFWGELQTFVECPWCLGFWVSVAVVAVVAQIVVVALPVLQVFAVACLVGLIGSNLDG